MGITGRVYALSPVTSSTCLTDSHTRENLVSCDWLYRRLPLAAQCSQKIKQSHKNLTLQKKLPTIRTRQVAVVSHNPNPSPKFQRVIWHHAPVPQSSAIGSPLVVARTELSGRGRETTSGKRVCHMIKEGGAGSNQSASLVTCRS